jgi:integrase
MKADQQNIIEKKLYNGELKLKYLSNQLPATQAVYLRVLARASEIEKSTGIDLHDFNLNQIEQLLKLLKSTKLSTVMHSGALIQSYIRWAIELGLREDKINPLDAVASGEWYKQFVNTIVKTLFSEDEIDNIVDGTINFQDKVVVRALFEGIYGKGYSELLNLKLSDIKEDTLDTRLIDETSEGIKTRIVLITPFLYELFKTANNETEYLKNNGIFSEYTRKKTSELIMNEYIVRTVIHPKARSLNNVRSESALINRRIGKIAEWHGQEGLTPTNIRNSGMLKMAYDIYKVKNDLDKNDYYLICKAYNVGRTKNGSYIYSRMRSDFLNIENIKEVYGLD